MSRHANEDVFAQNEEISCSSCCSRIVRIGSVYIIIT